MSFVVVEFLDEKAVEVVPKSWIMHKEKGLFCYWPPRAGAAAKVKKEEIPDKEKWNSYEIRIFSSAETYSKAQELSRRAEVTSNVETEPEGPKSRATKKPARYDFSDEADDEGDNPEFSHTPSVAVLPQSPHLNVGLSKTSSHHTKHSVVHERFSSPEWSDPSFKTRSSSRSSEIIHVNAQDLKKKYTSASSDRGATELVPVSQTEFAEFKSAVMANFKTIQENQRLMLSCLQSSSSGLGDDVEDVLPAPVSSLEELDDLNSKLADQSFKRNLTLYLSSFGGHSLGDAVRRIFKKLGTNSVWSFYSLKGKKGKLPFSDLPICKVIIRACMRTYKEAKTSAVEHQISEALKHAPKRKGGPKYKEPEQKRREHFVEESSNSSD